jgi:flavin reductase (DIM6/NTAB) family NADH-FMN oxidoreductase RutF
VSVDERAQRVHDVSDRLALRAAFGTFATGVTVFTVGGAAARGMTANSFTSVSLEPPLVLACVNQEASMHASVLAEQRFAVSVLAARQEPIARHFARTGRAAGPGQFDGIEWVPGPYTGAPLITGALAWFECLLWRSYDGGDHSIVVGRLLSAIQSNGGVDDGALLFHDGCFRRLP